MKCRVDNRYEQKLSETPLHTSCANGNFETMRFLVIGGPVQRGPSRGRWAVDTFHSGSVRNSRRRQGFRDGGQRSNDVCAAVEHAAYEASGLGIVKFRELVVEADVEGCCCPGPSGREYCVAVLRCLHRLAFDQHINLVEGQAHTCARKFNNLRTNEYHCQLQLPQTATSFQFERLYYKLLS